MTSEELILLLDSLQPRLPKCANQVLLRLVAKCITNGSNEVDSSAAELARELCISEDSVKVARRALSPIVSCRGRAGVPSIWTLPADWFVVQRSLFAIPSAVENTVQWPGNQGIKPWKPGHDMPQKPGHDALETRATALETRASWQSFQGIDSLETRAYAQENQADEPKHATETRASSIDRDRVLSSTDQLPTLRDSIEGVNWLPEELRDDGQQLKKWIRFYFAQSWPHRPIPDGPDEIIQAKCLAVAPLPRLQHVLSQLHKKKTQCGDLWPWFVTVFCQRVHATKNLASVRAPEGFRQAKKDPSSEGGANFRTGLLQEITAASGKLQ